MKGFFEGAKFGDKFVDADGKTLIYHYNATYDSHTYHYLIREEEVFNICGKELKRALYCMYDDCGDYAVNSAYRHFPKERINYGSCIIVKKL